MVNKLDKSAKIVVEVCMGIKKGERVLIVTDTPTEEIGDALFKASEKITETMMLKIPPTGEHGREPSKIVGKVMKEFDVVLCPTRFSLTHTKARKDASKAGVRIATLPRITLDMFTRTIDIDYKKMGKMLRELEKAMKNTKKVKITTNSGTNVILDISGRKRLPDTGLYTEKGDFGNLPAGEMALSPREGKTNGVIVIDTMEDICKPKTRAYVKNGLVQEVEGDKEFKDKLWKYKNARNIAELGIGTNPKAIISGNVLEDEKVLGTCHIAFGSNFSFPDGRVRADVHWDAILLKPTIWFDNRKVMDGGELLI